MICSRRAWLGLQEAVVDDVKTDEGERADCQHALAGDAGPHLAVGPLAERMRGCLGHDDTVGTGGA